MVAAPASGDPDVTANAITDSVTPHGIRIVAAPSSAGANADSDGARPRTNRSHDAGGSIRKSRSPDTPSCASPSATISSPAAIWVIAVTRGESCTALPSAPSSSPSTVCETSFPDQEPTYRREVVTQPL